MPNRTPDEVRWIVVHQHAVLGYDNDTIARNNMLSERTVRSILALWRSSGAVRTPTPAGILGRPKRFDFETSLYLHERITQTPSLYLDEIQEDLQQTIGLDVHPSTISRTLKRDGITRKKCHRDAMERSDELRDNYRILTTMIPAEYMVFVDESSVDRRTIERDHAYSLHGERVHLVAPFVRGDRLSMLPAMSQDGILALDVVKGSFTAETFRDFIAKVLNNMNPYPGKNSILVMDNCRIHKDPETLEMIAARGMHYIFLPPYSPDFNPIELAFSKIKQGLKRNGNRARTAMAKDNNNAEADSIGLIYEHVYSVSPDDAKGWFQHCYYF